MSDEASTIIQGYLKRMQDEYENFNTVYDDLLTKLNLAQTEYTNQDDQFKKLLTDETNLVTIYSSSTRQNFDTEFEKVQSAAQTKILNISQVPEELDEFIKLANLDLEGVRNQLNEISQNVSDIKDEANAQIDSINRELPKVTEAGQKAIEDMNKVVNQVTASGQTLQQQINDLDLRLSGIVNNQSNISKDITAIQETNKAITASQEALQQLLESMRTAVNEQIEQVNGTIETINNDLQGIKSELNKVPQQLATAYQDVMYVQYVKDTRVDILSKYTNALDLKRCLMPMSVNNTWQLGDMYIIPNTKQGVGTTFTGGTRLFEQYTDMVAPWGGLAAVDNIDGDKPDVTATEFTGGWHGYNNANSGTPTARTNSVRLYIDGVRVTESYTGYCHTVKVEVTNYIQAANTKKSAGGGREVLIEIVTYTFTNSDIDVVVDAYAIENVTLQTYYFLQCQRVYNFQNELRVSGDDSYRKPITSATIDVWGSAKTSPATKLSLKGDTDVITLQIDPTFDIGDNRFNTDSSVWFQRSYGKVYFRPINKLVSLSATERISAHGKYTIYRK